MQGSETAQPEETKPLLVDSPRAGVARLQLNRPHARNALNMALRKALASTFERLDQDDTVRCIVVCGIGPHFASGADLTEIQALGSAEIWRQQVPRYWKAIADCSKPVIAAVCGSALGGGCELALHADIIIAARSASFGQPEVGLGMMPGGGATQRLVKAIGKYQAMKLVLTGWPVTADEALSLGMISEVAPDDSLMQRALDMAAHIASRSPMAVRLIKEAVLAGSEAPLSTGLLLERRSFELLFDTPELKAGIQSFLTRRKPEVTASRQTASNVGLTATTPS